MTPMELEEEANTYAATVFSHADTQDRQWEVARGRRQPDPEPPIHTVPRRDGDTPPEFDERHTSIEQDEHLGRYAFIRLLRDWPECAAGEVVRTTRTEAAHAVRLGWAEYVPVPVVRTNREQLNTAWTIHRARTRDRDRP